jgi:ribosomal protein S18 acetylase RimI-like enzyme
MIIESMAPEHVKAVARLHCQGISSGFISSLGERFGTILYESMAQSEEGFGYVMTHGGRVAGFAAFSSNLGRLYRNILLRRGVRLTSLIAGRLLRWDQVVRVWQTLRYPQRMETLDLPEAELVSIAVAPGMRRLGLAKLLIQRGLAEGRKRGIEKIKVMVGASNEPANRMYQQCGFNWVAQIDSHGTPSNIYMIETKSSDEKTDGFISQAWSVPEELLDTPSDSLLSFRF